MHFKTLQHRCQNSVSSIGRSNNQVNSNVAYIRIGVIDGTNYIYWFTSAIRSWVYVILAFFADEFKGRDVITHEVAAVQLPTGLYFARLIARSVLEPTRYWQVADNFLELDGKTHYGVLRFVVE